MDGFAPFVAYFDNVPAAQAAAWEAQAAGDSAEFLLPSWYGALEISNKTVTVNNDGSVNVKGTLTNVGSQAAEFIKLVITLYDANDNVIAADFTFLPDPLKPGEAAEFDYSVTSLGGAAATFFLQAEGRVQSPQ